VTSTLVLHGKRGVVHLVARLVAGDSAVLWAAGVALGGIYLRFAWQAWHLVTSTFVLRGRRGTYCTWWRAWARLVAGDAKWQAWHLVTSTFVLRARRGTYGTGLAFTQHFVTHHL